MVLTEEFEFGLDAGTTATMKERIAYRYVQREIYLGRQLPDASDLHGR